MNDPNTMPWWGWLIVALILGGQGTYLFLDARKRGARAWLWGLLGLVQFPCPSLVYWFVIVRRDRLRE